MNVHPTQDNKNPHPTHGIWIAVTIMISYVLSASFGVLEILGRGYKFLVLYSASLPLQAELMFIESLGKLSIRRWPQLGGTRS